MVILGTTGTQHGLQSERSIFETLDGESRAYVMPFTRERKLRETGGAGGQTGLDADMWQLSFPLDEAAALALTQKGPSALRDEALRRVGSWKGPIGNMVCHTDLSDLTGYPIYDLQAANETFLGDSSASRAVTLVGDAAHPMAPFKGQGANQALLDATLLAQALYDSQFGDVAASALATAHSGDGKPGFRTQCDLREALGAFEACMMRRAVAKVTASREAARLLHSRSALAPALGRETRAAVSRRSEGESPGDPSCVDPRTRDEVE